jgi:large subunit ribosomal protein L15
MKLNELFDLPGAKRSRKRVGRGIGSGKGKTCGSGVKGQKSRSGVAIKGFEGGQMPLIARLPKRGFNCPSSTVFTVVNLTTITELVVAKKIKAGQKIDKEILLQVGVIKGSRSKVKLLGVGELTEKFEFSLDAYSKSAREAIEQAGGKIL